MILTRNIYLTMKMMKKTFLATTLMAQTFFLASAGVGKEKENAKPFSELIKPIEIASEMDAMRGYSSCTMGFINHFVCRGS